MTKPDLKGAAIIFDLDGTLIDTAGDLAASMNAALEAQGIAPVPAEEVRHLVGHGAKRMLQHGFELSTGRAPDDSAVEQALTSFLSHYKENIAVKSRPFEGVIEAIDELCAEGAVAAICTNKREAYARLLIEKLDLERLFVAIIGADTASAPKPDPAPVRLCMEKAAAVKGVFIGDSDTDIRAAEAAGLPSLIADFGYGPLKEISRARVVFSHYRQAPELVRKILG